MEYKDHHILRLIHFDNLEDTHRKYFYLKETIRLISGFESTLALEVLASVDFIRHNNPGISMEDTIAAIHNWSERKNKLFKNEYIQIAYDHLDTFYGESKLFAGL